MSFLEDLIRFTHIFLEHLEQFSKGKMLKIKTAKMRKVKKGKEKKRQLKSQRADHDSNEEEHESNEDGNFDPKNPDELS